MVPEALEMSGTVPIPMAMVVELSPRVIGRGGCNGQYVRKDRNTILVATHKHGLYHARVTPDNQKEAALATVDINLLHRHMGHISTNRIQHMVKSGQLQGIHRHTCWHAHIL